jgi:hypothetical protein
MRIATNGNVGIGTSTPIQTLDVVTAAGGTGLNIRSSSIGTNNEATHIRIGAGGGTTNAHHAMITGGHTTQGLTYLAFSTISDYATQGFNPVERMRISTAGNVGIGTTYALQKLDVRGSIRLGDTTTNEHLIEYVDEAGGVTVASSNGNLGYNISTNNALAGWQWRFVDSTAAGPGFNYFHVNYPTGDYVHKGGNISDGRSKTNFVSINGMDALNSITKLNPLLYNHKFSNGEVGDRMKGGFIAQEVIDVIPHLVGYDKDRDKPDVSGYAESYSLDYNGVFTYNVRATQEIYKLLLIEQGKVTNLETQLDSVLQRLDALENV